MFRLESHDDVIKLTSYRLCHVIRRSKFLFYIISLCFCSVFILGCILRFLLWLGAFLKWICPEVKIFSEEVPCVFFTYIWCFQGSIFPFLWACWLNRTHFVFCRHFTAAGFIPCSFYLFRWVRALLAKEEEMCRAVVRLEAGTVLRVLLLLVLLLSLYCVSSMCASYFVFYVSLSDIIFIFLGLVHD